MIDPEGRLLPDFLVVGAMRGGTNFLGHALAGHPEVSIARSELHFFDVDERFRGGAAAYARYFQLAPGEKVCGERTPAYSDPTRPGIVPAIPDRIASMLPEVKLVWSLRDPVERAWSHHWHEVARGRAGDSFEDELEAQQKSGERRFPRYLERGLYADQIRAFRVHYPPDRMHVILAETLFARPAETLRALQAFLGVDPDWRQPEDGPARNSSREIARFRAIDRMVGGRGRTRLSRRVQRLNKRLFRVPRPEMARETRRRLEAFYRPYNEDLARLVGLDLAGWSGMQE
jgi:hypothetical protein